MFTKKTVRFGVLIGLVGGGAMALFAMVMMWATGRGFVTVVNVFAHTFWKSAPLDGTFSLAAFELGLLIHLVVSICIGTAIAYFVERGSLDAGIIILLGIGVGTVVWVVQALAWTALDSQAHAQFTPWILATAHLVFALGAATFLTWLQRHDEVDSATPAPVEIERLDVRDRLAEPRPTRSGFSRVVRTTPAPAPTTTTREPAA